MMWISLPYPPSVNGLFFNRKKGGRGTTDRYKRWQSEALPAVCLAVSGRDTNGNIVSSPWRIDGPYGLTMEAGRPDARKRDISNLLKAAEDILVTGGAVKDDSLCQSVTAKWVAGLQGVRVLVLPTKEVEP